MADLEIGESPLNPNVPKDTDPISSLAAYIRETRRHIYYADIRNTPFEANVETGDAVFLDSEVNVWKRSLDDFSVPSRRRFHGIAHVGDDLLSVRVFGFVTYSFWAFEDGERVYVSSEDVGKITGTEPSHNEPLMVGTAVHIDSILIDHQLSYWEDLKNEIWNARGSFSSLQDRLDSEEGRLSDVEIAISDAEGSFETLTLRLDDFENRISTLEGYSLDTRVTGIENEVETARDGESNLDARIDRDYNTIASVQSEVQDARGSASNLDSRLDVSINEDGTLKSTTTVSLWIEETDANGKVNSTTFTVTGDKTSVYVYGMAIRIDESDSNISHVSSSSYDSVNDLTSVVLLTGILSTWPFTVERTIPPEQFPKIEHSDLGNIMGAVSGTDTTKNKHISNEQLSNLSDADTVDSEDASDFASAVGGAGSRQAQDADTLDGDHASDLRDYAFKQAIIYG